MTEAKRGEVAISAKAIIWFISILRFWFRPEIRPFRDETMHLRVSTLVSNSLFHRTCL
jgi:hypothetical protein